MAVFFSPLVSGPLQAADADGTIVNAVPEPADAAIRDLERKALIAFYEALGGPDWIQRDFWASDEPVGRWHGIETDSDGYVVRLTIYDNNLEGRMPGAICDLERLHTLHLSFNKISGRLPEGFGRCRAMKNLWLKGNKITGSLPDGVAMLPELEYLDLHANQMSGKLPERWATPKLEIFRGEDNDFTGKLPAALFQQQALKEIFLHNNKFSGKLPGTLSQARSLTSLLLANNRLTGSIPPDIGGLTKLTDLRLNRNRLTGEIPESLAEIAPLQVLRLDHNNLSPPVPEGLQERLTVFDVSGNPKIDAD
ncbi:leucine-rich repeat domain-containing protein [Methyloligella solikamskensis]|uniref:Leucine-rich repeat domain-containing protein n=1 Tax=Methyloligella solikamskensis TaxID=1177756 RepID=A0ABW3JBH0_9HYPH